jgi:hypothetical protein
LLSDRLTESLLVKPPYVVWRAPNGLSDDDTVALVEDAERQDVAALILDGTRGGADHRIRAAYGARRDLLIGTLVALDDDAARCAAAGTDFVVLDGFPGAEAVAAIHHAAPGVPIALIEPKETLPDVDSLVLMGVNLILAPPVQPPLTPVIKRIGVHDNSAVA